MQPDKGAGPGSSDRAHGGKNTPPPETTIANTISSLVRSIDALTEVIREGQSKSCSCLATKNDLAQMETKIMSAISDYTDKVNAAFDSIGADVDTAVSSIGGVQTDVTFLKDTITKLNNSPGSITPADQALLDAAAARATALQTKVAAVKETLATLDASTEEPPTPPADVPPVVTPPADVPPAPPTVVT